MKRGDTLLAYIITVTFLVIVAVLTIFYGRSLFKFEEETPEEGKTEIIKYWKNFMTADIAKELKRLDNLAYKLTNTNVTPVKLNIKFILAKYNERNKYSLLRI